MSTSVSGLSGLRPVSELAAGRPHGDRLRYLAGCRCADCRRANTQYELQRSIARRSGDWNGFVSADRARAHLASLSAACVGRRQVADAACVGVTVVFQIAAGEKTRIRARTERRILAVTAAAAADRAFVDGEPTWKLIDELVSWGYSKAQLARELGHAAPALQIRRTQCTVRNAHEVKQLHARLRRVPYDATQRLIAELRDEAFRQDQIEAKLTALAKRCGMPAPDLTVHRGWISASTADLVERLHTELTEVPA